MEELDLRILFATLWKKKILIIIVTAAFVLAGALYAIQFKTPLYRSSTTLVLAQSNQNEPTASTTLNDINLNQKLVSTYSELIKSKTLVRQAISNLANREQDPISDLTEDIRKDIIVSAVKDTAIIEITVVNKTKKYSADIANELAAVFMEEVQQIFKGIDNVRVVDRAEEANSAYNTNAVRDIAMFAAIGFILCCILVIVLGLLDNTVKNEEDVERLTGLKVLTSIPQIQATAKKKGN